MSLKCIWSPSYCLTLRPRQNGRHFADDIFKRIFLKENVLISLKISLKFVAKVRINNIPALVQIMAWRRLGDKPLSEPMMVSLLTHICVTRPQWVNHDVTHIHIGDVKSNKLLFKSIYRKTSDISRPQSKNLNVSRIVLQLSSPNPLKPGVKSGMKM